MEESEKSYTELLKDLQQQIMLYKETTSRKLQKIEDFVEVTAQQMEILQKRQFQQSGLNKLKSPFVEAKTAGSDSLELVPHIKLHFPSYKGGNNQQLNYKFDTEICTPKSSFMDAKEEMTAAYEGAPIFDEDLSDDMADWHCNELLCKALGLEDSFKAKQNSDNNSTDAKVLDCTSVFKPDDKKNLDVATKFKSQMSKDLTTVVQREELRLQEPIPCSYSYSLDKATCKCIRGQVHNFDPGGHVQHDHSTCVLKMFKARTRNKLLQELNVLREEVNVVQMVQLAELHDQDVQTYNCETYRVIIKMNPQTVDSMYQTGFDTKNVMKIFDPGGRMHKGWGLYYPEFEDLQTNCQQVCLFIVSKEGPTTRLDNNQSVLVPKECSKGMTDESVQVLGATTDMYSYSKRARLLARPSRCIDLRQGSPGKRFLNTMRAIQCALIVGSSVQIILGYSQLWPIFSRFFSLLGMVLVVAMIGFGLFDRGFPVVGQWVKIGVPMLILFVFFSQYLKNFQTKQVPLLERFAPIFDAGHAFGMMAAVFVSMIESTGAYKAESRFANATPPPAHVLSRRIGWQGIGILLDGLFGTLTGSTVSVENVGLLGSTRVGSGRVVQISAGSMIFFSMLGLSILECFREYIAGALLVLGIPMLDGSVIFLTQYSDHRQMLQGVLTGKDLYTDGKERTRVESLSRMYEGWPKAMKNVQLATMRTWCKLRGKDCEECRYQGLIIN